MMEGRLYSVTLQKLRIFAAVADERSFAKAADVLDLSSPTLSEQIRSLEGLIGARLLHRSRGRRLVGLTEAGQILLESYSEISQSLEKAVRALEAIKQLERGTVALGVGLTFGGCVFPVLNEFHRTHPGIAVHVDVDQSRHILESLRQRRLDFAILLGPDEQAGFAREPLIPCYIVLVGLSGHRLAGISPAPFRELAQERWVLGDHSTVFRRILDRIAAEAGITLNVGLEVSDVEARLQAVLGGVGITVLSSHSVVGIAADQLCILNVQKFPIRMQLLIVHLPAPLSPAAKALKDYLLQSKSMLADLCNRPLTEIGGLAVRIGGTYETGPKLSVA